MPLERILIRLDEAWENEDTVIVPPAGQGVAYCNDRGQAIRDAIDIVADLQEVEVLR